MSKPPGIPVGNLQIPEGALRDSFFRPLPTKEERLALELDETRRQRDELKAAFERLNTQAFNVARVAAIYDERILVRGGSSYIEAARPGFPLAPGQLIRVATPSNQIVGVVSQEPTIGHLATVTAVDGDRCEMEIGQAQRSVMLCPHVTDVAIGTPVVLDDTISFIVAKALEPNSEYELEQPTNVSWSDIGGHEEAKESLREAIEYPIRFGHLYRGYGQRLSKGVLLYGPPGTGKTLLARAAATAQRAALGNNAPGGFISIKGPEVLDKFIGESERAVRKVFADARRYKEKTGHPAVIFFDEADALLTKRTVGEGSTFDSLKPTIVTTFLAEMDGMDESSAFVILATNRSDMLDAAIVRDGRIDRKIQVGRPTQEVAREILRLAMKGRPVAEPLDGLLDSTIRHVFDDGNVVREIGEHQGKPVRLLLRDVVSGAVLAGIANRATMRALRRDREKQLAHPTGITGLDLSIAARESAAELARTDLHNDVLDVLRRLQAASPIVQEASHG